jgi:hypothetical protein
MDDHASRPRDPRRWLRQIVGDHAVFEVPSVQRSTELSTSIAKKGCIAAVPQSDVDSAVKVVVSIGLAAAPGSGQIRIGNCSCVASLS